MNFNGAPNPNGRNIAMASLRAVVAGYLIYLGGKIIYDHVKGQSEMIPWMCWFFGILFILAGSAFLIYTWMRYKKEKAEQAQEAAQETPVETAEEPEKAEEIEEAEAEPAEEASEAETKL